MKLLISLSILLSFISCTKEGEKKTASSSQKNSTGTDQKKEEFYYTCSMHPKVREKGPGKCPICHMNLTRVEIDDESDENQVSSQNNSNSKISKKDEKWYCKDFPEVVSKVEIVCPMDGTPMILAIEESIASQIIGEIKLRKSQLKHFFPSYFPATKMLMTKKILLLGMVLQSEEKESKISARIDGRVEKVYIKSTGSMINKGDPVVDLYSPKLITAGEEYLIARKSFENLKSKETREMLEQSEERLKLWGVKSFQYHLWYKKRTIPTNITLYSSANGIVRKRNAIVGKYFKEGQNFFELSDLSDVWVEMDVYEHDSSLVSIGQKVKMEFTSLPGTIMEGEIDFIDPILNSSSRTLKIRTTISNKTGKLKPGMVAEATLEIALEGKPLVIPRTAIIDTGKRKVIWVKVSNKQFRAKVVRTGHEVQGYVEIKEGLKENEEVVIDANFLLDAQAQLFGGYEDIKENKSGGHNH